MINERDLVNAWFDAFEGLGVRYEDAPSPVPVMDRYREEHRHYHTLDHIYYMLKSVGYLSYTVAHLDPVLVLATFYHDCVYKIGEVPRVNEIASAMVMVEDLGDYLPNFIVREISSHIIATFPGDYKHPPRTLNEAILRDADLAGFMDREVCFANDAKIRKEFGAATDEQYAEGRKAFLQSMLDLTQIYWSPAAISEGWEEKARENIASEMRRPVNAPLAAQFTHTQGPEWHHIDGSLWKDTLR